MLNSREYLSLSYIPYKSIPFETVFWPFFLLLEMIFYWILRNRLQKRLWVHIHIWSVCLGLMILPLLIPRISVLVFQYNAPLSILRHISQFHFYLFWLSIGVGHIFFIATIVKSLSKKQEMIVDEPAPGLLDEFAD